MDIDKILERHNKAFHLQSVILKTNAKQAIKEIVKETLRMAAESAETCYIENTLGSLSPIIDKYSITNVYNKIKF